MATQLSNGAWVGISIGSGILIASLIGGIGIGISTALRPPLPAYTPPPYIDPDGDFGDYSDLETGDPGPATPVAPMTCDGACFDESSAEAAILSDATFSAYGFPVSTDTWGSTGMRTTAAELLPIERDAWVSAGFPDDGCFVTWSDSPVIEATGTVVGEDVVADLTENSAYSGGLDRVLQSVRLFPDAAAAQAYMVTLDAGLAGCTEYLNTQGYGYEVSREPALAVPDSVAAVGFVKSPDPGLRSYVFDLQRGNLVIRTVAVSQGAIDDPTFRELVQEQADLLAELVPAG